MKTLTYPWTMTWGGVTLSTVEVPGLTSLSSGGWTKVESLKKNSMPMSHISTLPSGPPRSSVSRFFFFFDFYGFPCLSDLWLFRTLSDLWSTHSQTCGTHGRHNNDHNESSYVEASGEHKASANRGECLRQEAVRAPLC